jgi:hypothetical protein
MRKSLFQIDDGPVYIGYTSGVRWNGWATPYFTYEEAQKLQAEINQCEGMRMFYDCSADRFYWQHEDDDEPYIWEGEDIQTEDGIKHLYGIGAYSHIWDELGSEEKRYLAQQINDFMYDYDPYDYDDNVDDADDFIDELIELFADIDKFAKVHLIMNGDWSDKDAIYTQLKEVLTL